MGRLFFRKHESEAPVGTRDLPKFENRDFRWLLTFGILGVRKQEQNLIGIVKNHLKTYKSVTKKPEHADPGSKT